MLDINHGNNFFVMDMHIVEEVMKIWRKWIVGLHRKNRSSCYGSKYAQTNSSHEQLAQDLPVLVRTPLLAKLRHASWELIVLPSYGLFFPINLK